MNALRNLACLLLLVTTISSPAAAEIVISYWAHSTGTTDTEMELVKQFNEMHKGQIRVETYNHSGTTQLREKLTVGIATGTAPEIVKFDRFAVSEWAYQGMFRPISDLANRDKIKASDYYPAAIGEMNLDGTLYGLPWDMDVRGYVYNKTAFAESGIANPPATWDEAERIAKRLDRMVGGAYSRMGFIAKEGNWYFYGWLLAAGGDILDATRRKVTWNNDIGRKAAHFIQDNTARYGGTAAITALRNKDKSLYGALGTGRIASVMHGSFAIGGILKAVPDADIGVAPAPRPTGMEKNPIAWSGGFGLVMPITTTDPAKVEAAWEFMKFFGGKEAMIYAFGSEIDGRIPTLRSAALDKRFIENQPKAVIDFVSLLPYSYFRLPTPVSQSLWGIYHTEITSTIVDKLAPVEATLDDTAARGQRLLDEGWSKAKI